MYPEGLFNFLFPKSPPSGPPWVMSLLPAPCRTLLARTRLHGVSEEMAFELGLQHWGGGGGDAFPMQGRARQSGVAQVGRSTTGRSQAWEALNARLNPPQSPGALSDCTTKMGMEMESEPG